MNFTELFVLLCIYSYIIFVLGERQIKKRCIIHPFCSDICKIHIFVLEVFIVGFDIGFSGSMDL